MDFIFAEFSPPAKSPSGHAQCSGSGETSVQGREQTPPAAAASRSPPQLEAAAAVTSPADDTAPTAAARSERGDSETSTSQSQGSDGLPDHTEFDAAEFDHDDADADAGDAGFQCSSCSSKFMSETSMRIHTVQCKSRHSELLQNRYSTELQFIVLNILAFPYSFALIAGMLRRPKTMTATW